MLNTNELFELDACEFASIIVNDSTEAPDIHVNSTTNIHEKLTGILTMLCKGHPNDRQMFSGDKQIVSNIMQIISNVMQISRT